jgi:hypothetical protein
MSEDKAQALAERFGTLKSITDVIDTAYKCGIRAFMLNTNERAIGICDYLRDHLKDYPDICSQIFERSCRKRHLRSP